MSKTWNGLVHAVAALMIVAGMPAMAAPAASSKEPVARKAKAQPGSTSKAKRRVVVGAAAAGAVAAVAARPSHGQIAGLHSTQDELDLRSSVALVIDQDTREVLLQKNDTAVLPIASLTKLMTGMVISEAGQCLVMQAKVAGRRLVMVFLDSAGKLSRIADAERVRRWVEHNSKAAMGNGATAARSTNG